MKATRTVEAQEAKRMLDFLRAVGTEDQRIAFAVLEGMRLQKAIDVQRIEGHQGQRDRPT